MKCQESALFWPINDQLPDRFNIMGLYVLKWPDKATFIIVFIRAFLKRQQRLENYSLKCAKLQASDARDTIFRSQSQGLSKDQLGGCFSFLLGQTAGWSKTSLDVFERFVDEQQHFVCVRL